MDDAKTMRKKGPMEGQKLQLPVLGLRYLLLAQAVF